MAYAVCSLAKSCFERERLNVCSWLLFAGKKPGWQSDCAVSIEH